MIGVTSAMAANPQTPPALFDRALLCARQRRAQAQGAVSFLLDRVAEDMSDRLAAVMREFHAPSVKFYDARALSVGQQFNSLGFSSILGWHWKCIQSFTLYRTRFV